MREHESRHPISQRCLADALRAADQPGMRNAPAAIAIEQRCLRRAMPEQFAGLARAPDRDLIFGLARAHAAVADVAVANRRARSAVHTWAATASGLALASISTQRLGSSIAISR